MDAFLFFWTWKYKHERELVPFLSIDRERKLVKFSSER